MITVYLAGKAGFLGLSYMAIQYNPIGKRKEREREVYHQSRLKDQFV
jgi:hypothetical protein